MVPLQGAKPQFKQFFKLVVNVQVSESIFGVNFEFLSLEAPCTVGTESLSFIQDDSRCTRFSRSLNLMLSFLGVDVSFYRIRWPLLTISNVLTTESDVE